MNAMFAVFFYKTISSRSNIQRYEIIYESTSFYKHKTKSNEEESNLAMWNTLTKFIPRVRTLPNLSSTLTHGQSSTEPEGDYPF